MDTPNAKAKDPHDPNDATMDCTMEATFDSNTLQLHEIESSSVAPSSSSADLLLPNEEYVTNHQRRVCYQRQRMPSKRIMFVVAAAGTAVILALVFGLTLTKSDSGSLASAGSDVDQVDSNEGSGSRDMDVGASVPLLDSTHRPSLAPSTLSIALSHESESPTLQPILFPLPAPKYDPSSVVGCPTETELFSVVEKGSGGTHDNVIVISKERSGLNDRPVSSSATWVVRDRCTREIVIQCPSSCDESATTSPFVFGTANEGIVHEGNFDVNAGVISACIPSGREYVLEIKPIDGETSCCGFDEENFAVTYGDDIVLQSDDHFEYISVHSLTRSKNEKKEAKNDHVAQIVNDQMVLNATECSGLSWEDCELALGCEWIRTMEEKSLCVASSSDMITDANGEEMIVGEKIHDIVFGKQNEPCPTVSPTTHPASSRGPSFVVNDGAANEIISTSSNTPTSTPVQPPTTEIDGASDRPSSSIDTSTSVDPDNTTKPPTSTPTSTPTQSPTPRSDRPSSAPSQSGKDDSSMSVTAAPSLVTSPPVTAQPQDGPPTSDNKVISCPPAGNSTRLSAGIASVFVSPINTFCGIFIQKNGNTLIPFAKSYDGYEWEASPGPLASPSDGIVCTNDICMIELPEHPEANLEYIILTKDGTMDQRKQIAKFLEMTTFGVRKEEINALDNVYWGDVTRAQYVRQQMDMNATSHREFFRKRANTNWGGTMQSLRSDHPCSPYSKWRKYAFVKEDMYNADESKVEITFETVSEQTNYVLYEADSLEDVLCGTCDFQDEVSSGKSGYAGEGFYSFGGSDDFIQWDVVVSESGSYPLSFRYALKKDSPLLLYVNGELAYEYELSGLYGSGFWRYSAPLEIDLVEGANTVRLMLVTKRGPLLDHMRLGKPPAVVIKTNGWPRTVVTNGIGLGDWNLEVSDDMIAHFAKAPEPPHHELDLGRTRISIEKEEFFLDVGNPQLFFTGYEQYLSNYIEFTNSDVFVQSASEFDEYHILGGQELLLRDGSDDSFCDNIPVQTKENSAPIFGLLPNGEWLQWTPTISFEDNGPSINTPPSDHSKHTLSDGGGKLSMCSNVKRSLLNEDTCILSADIAACSSSQGNGEIQIHLNQTNIMKFYATSRQTQRNYVYAIQGLSFDGIDQHFCTQKRTRWTIDWGRTCTEPTKGLGDNTNAAIIAAIDKSKDENEIVKVISRSKPCDEDDITLDTLGMQVQFGPDCYTHVHPDHWNVYDFTQWARLGHPGGSRHIEKWAEGFDDSPGWYLNFPNNHDMIRWNLHSNGRHIQFIGRMGDTVLFRDLPSDLKTVSISNHFSQTSSTAIDGEGVVVCGSHSEVSNDNSLGEVFDLRSEEENTKSLSSQKHTVWTEVNLFGNDQLRQRMAWALAQILVVVPEDVNAKDHTEVFLAYYDIFVRNAFGNYRDILREISYSPLMAENLSFLGSMSHSYAYSKKNLISRADENFSREIMQLFSIGLIKLRNDGTPVLDSNGVPIKTYNNEDIESLARAWTGFDRVANRGNIEVSSTNKLDPTQIIAAWRDPFPKTNLDSGYIGDRYALCTDLPEKSFLKKGARYRLLGGSPSAEYISEPSQFGGSDGAILRMSLDPSSMLYQKLFNGGQYKTSVELDEDLDCNKNECAVDTIRVVKVGSVYFEYVSTPCVQMAFFNNGKMVQLRDSFRRGRICVNPSLPLARPACCRQEREGEVGKATLEAGTTYLYEGERTTFLTARDRCLGKDLCAFETVSVSPHDDDWRKGYHWTNLNCAINVKIDPDGHVAVVHDIDSSVPSHVNEGQTLNWFKVFWEGDYPGSSNENSCEANKCRTVDGNCVCKTFVQEVVVFDNLDITKQDILSRLFVGAVGPLDGSTPNAMNGYVAHVVSGTVDERTVFEVEENGKTYFLKNMESIVSLEGWQITPKVIEAEDGTTSNAAIADDDDLTYVELNSEMSSIEWVVNSETSDSIAYISFRYSLKSSPTPFSVYVNSKEIVGEQKNTIVSTSDLDGSPSELQRCEGSCKNDDDCSDGLFCMRERDYGIEFPGCISSPQNEGSYCVDAEDFRSKYGMLFYPTGSKKGEWRFTKPLQVPITAGENKIKLEAPVGNSGVLVDYLRIEGISSSTTVSFRNPPHFLSLIPDSNSDELGEMTLRDAVVETDAVLDHYFYHDNVAPFICIRIIQRFGVSNPSPRFVSECSSAFISGSYNSGYTTFGSGEYGSLEALAAAVVLDREANNPVASNDPIYGHLKEPLMKLMGIMRSLDFRATVPKNMATTMERGLHVKLILDLEEKIGEFSYNFPSVFSFFEPNYVPNVDPFTSGKLYSPEAMLVTMPNTVNFLNGAFSLIKYGLNSCNSGFSSNPNFAENKCTENGLFENSFGHLQYEPEGVGFRAKIEDLSLLLTAGRLSEENIAIIEEECSSLDDSDAMVRCAQQLIITSAEFHTSQTVLKNGKSRTTETVDGSSTEETEYKAIVYLYLNGGCDSYNMLAPYECSSSSPDVYDLYRKIRGQTVSSEGAVSDGVGLPRDRMLEIKPNYNNHPCNSFGIHDGLQFLKQLYADGQLSFIANTGLLFMPVNKTSKDETPVQLFSHNSMKEEAARVDLGNVYTGTGFGGRVADVLTERGIPANLFSLNSLSTLLTGQGSLGPSQFILSTGGVASFNEDPSIENMMDIMKSINGGTDPSSGFFAEIWSKYLSDGISKQQFLEKTIGSIFSNTVFPTSDIGQQLEIATRLMQTRDARGAKRDIFYVVDGQYDTHSNVDERLSFKFGELDNALKSFVDELKTLGLWEKVTLVQFSEFGRTLEPNTGDGTDHAWGGHHFMLGGSVSGGKVLGEYPSSFDSTNSYALSRGRMVPKYPWDAMLKGTAEWFGILSPDMSKVLPMHSNFPPSLLYGKEDLFVDPQDSTEEDI